MTRNIKVDLKKSDSDGQTYIEKNREASHKIFRPEYRYTLLIKLLNLIFLRIVM